MKKFWLIILCWFFAISLVSCEAEEPKESIAPAKIGTMQKIKDLETTITDYEFSIYAGALNGLAKVESGYKYCVVYLEAKNIGSVSLSPSDYVFTLCYDSGYRYNSTWINYTEFFSAHDSIPALGSLSDVCLCFKVPVEVEDNSDIPLTIELKENSTKAKDVAVWQLR